MLERYTREKMGAVWTLENQYRSWLKVELAVTRAQGELGLVPAAEAREILEKAAFDVRRIREIESEVNHDVVAFITSVEEKVGPAGRFFHFGLTSSDILDSSLALRLLEALGIIEEELAGLVAALADKSLKNISLLSIGRSHGVHAEPTPLGLKFASHASEFKRHQRRLENLKENLSLGKISGPVGNYSARSISPELEERALGYLGLKPAPVSTQVVPRDVHAEFFLALSLLGASLERLAVEARHLARTEVGEAEEAFGPGQKGSSAMPHKKNPVGAENITGLARLLKAYGEAALDDVALWHERDISHSSVERVIAPDATILADYALHRAAGLVRNLVVKPEMVERNLNLTGGLYHSQELLLALCAKGLSRVQAYRLVQNPALMAKDLGLDFKTLVLESQEIRSHLNPTEIEEIFQPDRFAKWAPAILERGLGK
ncbi:MAG: adenylosuccinate lyase [Deltaproteobacteria bacterium]|jgi:adenylosuccinate lyase|nr:adenylosuccinate lyase [Deltaproteobacteria bacterium]